MKEFIPYVSIVVTVLSMAVAWGKMQQIATQLLDEVSKLATRVDFLEETCMTAVDCGRAQQSCKREQELKFISGEREFSRLLAEIAGIKEQVTTLCQAFHRMELNLAANGIGRRKADSDTL